MRATDAATRGSTSSRDPAAPVPADLAPRRPWGAESLGTAFAPRRNSLAVLRLLLAGLVAVTHGLFIGSGWQPRTGGNALGDYAVDGFFVLSGFLVARSYLRLDDFWRYAWHRFLRIVPGFWVCLVVTAVVIAPLAALLTGRGVGSVFTAEQDPAWQYVLHNAALPILQYEIAGLQAPHADGILDGALWTLQYEAFCYLVVAVLGVTAVFRRRPWVLLALVGAAYAGVVLEHLGLIPYDVPLLANQELFRFLLVFLLGAAAHVYADRVPVHRGLAALSAAVVLATAWLPDYHLVGAFSLAYLCLYAVVRLPLTAQPRWDLSYGLYIYHWPVQFLLALTAVSALGPWVFVPVSIALALVLAAISWVAVESPALARKDARWIDRLPGGRRPHATAARS